MRPVLRKVKTISWREANLTPVISKLQNMESGYVKNSRYARYNTDVVFSLYNPISKFLLEYTVKSIEGREKGFVNWARVSGPDAVVDKFLAAVGIEENIIISNNL